MIPLPENQYQRNKYSENGDPSGVRYLGDVRNIISERMLAFRCDQPTEAMGNCFPYAVMQQLHRPQIRSTLSEEMKHLSENCHDLRTSIVQFVKRITPTSQYYPLINESRNQWILAIGNDWDQRLELMSTDRQWFDDQFMQFTAWFLKRDIICYTINWTKKFCASAVDRPCSFREMAPCNCAAEPLHIANVTNVHYQSLLPIETPEINTTSNTQQNKSNSMRH